MSSSILSSFFRGEAEASTIKATIAVAPDLSCFYIAVGPMPDSIDPKFEQSIRRGFQQLSSDVGYAYVGSSMYATPKSNEEEAKKSLNLLAQVFIGELNRELEQTDASQEIGCKLVSNEAFKKTYPNDERSKHNFGKIDRGNPPRWRSTLRERVYPLNPAVYIYMEYTPKGEQSFMEYLTTRGEDFDNFNTTDFDDMSVEAAYGSFPASAVRDNIRTIVQTYTKHSTDDVLVFVDRAPEDHLDHVNELGYRRQATRHNRVKFRTYDV